MRGDGEGCTAPSSVKGVRLWARRGPEAAARQAQTGAAGGGRDSITQNKGERLTVPEGEGPSRGQQGTVMSGGWQGQAVVAVSIMRYQAVNSQRCVAPQITAAGPRGLTEMVVNFRNLLWRFARLTVTQSGGGGGGLTGGRAGV